MKRALLCVLCLMFLIFAHGCMTPEDRIETRETHKGQITLFLKGADKVSRDITFNLSAINIVSENGTVREIMSAPVKIRSISMRGKQILLAEMNLDEDRYTKLQLVVEDPSIMRKDQPARLAIPPDGIEIPVDITVRRNQNTSLFLSWNADLSITGEYLFNPVFTVKGQVPELSTLLIYATNEESDNVSVINRETEEVVATIMVGRRPRGIGVGSGPERLKVYVANSDSNSVSVIDPTTNKVENEIPIRFGRQPQDLASARLSPDRELIFIANYGSHNVSVVDAATYQEIEKIEVGNGPVAVAVDPPVERLIGTTVLSTEDINFLKNYREKFLNVYIVNKNSNTISILRIDILNGKTRDVMNINVGWSPVAIAMDYQRGKIYVANYGSDNLSVIDVLEVAKGDRSGAVSTIENVGTSVTGVIADPSFDRVYLLKDMPAEIMIIRPFSEKLSSFKTVITPIMGTIPVGISPRALLLDPESRKLYVVNRGSNSVSVIDKITKREEQVIPVGKKPYGIAIFQP